MDVDEGAITVAISNSTLALVSTAPNVARTASVGRASLGPDDVLISTLYSALMRDGSFPLETLVGPIATDAPSIAALADATIAGSVAPTAAAIDWRGLQPI